MDADVVLFIFREEYYKEREKPGDQDLDALIKWQEEMEHIHGKAELIIGNTIIKVIKRTVNKFPGSGWHSVVIQNKL